jgi:predicted nucleic acid-binding protein
MAFPFGTPCLAACLDAGVNILYSENVPAVKTFQTVRLVNPFQ